MMKKIMAMLMVCSFATHMRAASVPIFATLKEKKEYLRWSFERCEEYDGPYGDMTGLRLSGNRFSYRIAEQLHDYDVLGLKQTLKLHASARELLKMSDEEYTRKFIQEGLCYGHSIYDSPLVAMITDCTMLYDVQVYRKKLAMAQLLLEYGAAAEGPVVFNDDFGTFVCLDYDVAPLHLAARFDDKAFFALLLKYTKNIHVFAKIGRRWQTAYDVARRWERDELKKTIEDFVEKHPEQAVML